MNENEKITSKRDLIAPIVSIVAFLLLLGGASYAYYNIGATATGGNVAGNVQIPARCVATVTANQTCSASLNTSQMNPENKGVASNIASCGFSITVNGNQGCTCTYTTQLLTTNATSYTGPYYVSNAISYYINGDRSVSETNVTVGWTNNTSVLGSKSLIVTNTGTAVTENLTLYMKMKNLDESQDGYYSNGTAKPAATAGNMVGRSYVMYLYASPSCSIPTS